MRSRCLFQVVALMVLVGCSGSPEETPGVSAQDAKAIKVTKPDATAADNAKSLAAADMDPEVKKILGSAGR